MTDTGVAAFFLGESQNVTLRPVNYTVDPDYPEVNVRITNLSLLQPDPSSTERNSYSHYFKYETLDYHICRK